MGDSFQLFVENNKLNIRHLLGQSESSTLCPGIRNLVIFKSSFDAAYRCSSVACKKVVKKLPRCILTFLLLICAIVQRNFEKCNYAILKHTSVRIQS